MGEVFKWVGISVAAILLVGLVSVVSAAQLRVGQTIKLVTLRSRQQPVFVSVRVGAQVPEQQYRALERISSGNKLHANHAPQPFDWLFSVSLGATASPTDMPLTIIWLLAWRTSR